MSIKKNISNSLYSLLLIIGFCLTIYFLSLQNDDGYNFMPGFVFLLVWILAILIGFIVVAGQLLKFTKYKNKFGYNFIGTVNFFIGLLCVVVYCYTIPRMPILLWLCLFPLLFGIIILADIYDIKKRLNFLRR
jgi:uncharacterized protein with PQ loop repeat